MVKMCNPLGAILGRLCWLSVPKIALKAILAQEATMVSFFFHHITYNLDDHLFICNMFSVYQKLIWQNYTGWLIHIKFYVVSWSILEYHMLMECYPLAKLTLYNESYNLIEQVLEGQKVMSIGHKNLAILLRIVTSPIIWNLFWHEEHFNTKQL